MTRLFITFSILFFSSLTATAQNNYVWTWMAGDTYGYNPVRGTKGVPGYSNAPGNRQHSATWTDTSGTFWLYGGSGNLGGYSDLWKYDIQTNMWTWVSGDSVSNQLASYGVQGVSSPANKPGDLFGAYAWTDHDNNLWLYGGWGHASNTGQALVAMSDLWKYNIATNEWTWMKGNAMGDVPVAYGIKGVANTQNSPGGRFDGTTWKDGHDNLFLFGGFIGGFGNDGNDLWRYSILTNEWTWISGDNVTNAPGLYVQQGVLSAAFHPASKVGAQGWIDDNGVLWLMGGHHVDPSGLYNAANDMWSYNQATDQWTWVRGDSAINTPASYGPNMLGDVQHDPGGRTGSATWVDKYGNFWLLGGCVNAYFRNDMWRYTPQTNEWMWVRGSTALDPAPVFGSIGVPAPANTPGRGFFGNSWIAKNGDLWAYSTGFSEGKTMWRFGICSNDIPLISISENEIYVNGSYASYQWYKDGTLLPTATASTFVYSQDADYYVVVTDSNGCSSQSNIINTAVAASVQNVHQNIFSLYPNPTNGVVYIESVMDGHCNVYSVDGKVQMNSAIQKGKTTIRIPAGLSQGIYFIRCQFTDGTSYTERLLYRE